MATRRRLNGGNIPTRVRPPQPTRFAGESVVTEPWGAPIAPIGNFIFQFATVADDLPAWGTNIQARDRALRQFWPSEPMTASAVYSMCSKYASLKWALNGPARTVGIYQYMLNSCERGKGWITMWMKVLQDLFTQDNGAFIETVRADDRPESPCVSLNQLDSNRCIRTGHPDTPVMYYDIKGAGHLLKYYQVLTLEEFPSPIEIARNIQICAISRLLRAAQIMRDISIYKREKVSGRFNKAIHFVSGVNQAMITDAMQKQALDADNEGLMRFVQPLIIGSLDPSAPIKVDTLPIASLPDNFNEEETLRWFIAQLALAFGGDYQDFAPLPTSTNAGGAQARMLHNKSLSKGTRLFMEQVTQLMNYSGILPDTIYFTYEESDPQQDAELADLKLTRAKERQVRILSGELNLAVARQVAVDEGDLEEQYLLLLNQEPINEDVAVQSDVPYDAQPELLDIADEGEYEGTPADQTTIPGAMSTGFGSSNGGDTSNSPNKGANSAKPSPSGASGASQNPKAAKTQ